jgi:HPt (histidine-containing phosphotransfer) domain-containing protein
MSTYLDQSALDELRALGGDEFLTELVDTFLADAPALLAGLRSDDVDEVRRAAHTLKTNGATFGAGHFAELCRELEERARNGDLDGAADLIARVEADYGLVAEALRAERSA